jgi:hypothetical protein
VRFSAAGARGGPAAVRPPGRRRSFLSGVLAKAEGFLLEPAEPESSPVPLVRRASRAVIAVYGLAAGCGTTTVARALAAEMARRDPSGAAGVMCEARTSAIPLATQDASRLARAFEEIPGTVTRAVGRLALVRAADPLPLAESARHLAPLVLDAGATSLGGVPAAVADLSVVVTGPGVEPSLARVAAECLQRVGPAPLVVLNRGERVQPGWAEHERTGSGVGGNGAMASATATTTAVATAVATQPAPAAGSAIEQSALGTLMPAFAGDLFVLPDSRVGAQLALGGREARGELGRAVATLADRCEAPGQGVGM